MSDYDAAFTSATQGGKGNAYDDIMRSVMGQSAPTQAAEPAPVSVKPAARPSFDVSEGMLDRVKNYDPSNAIGGQIRGAGSIGATLMAPVDWAAQQLGISNSIIGRDDRRQQLDPAIQQLTGADPKSVPYQTNKLMTEVAGTSGIGGLIANGLRMIPGAASALPTLLPAIESGGMSANGAAGAYGMANRVAGGAVNGAAMAGAVDPKDAGTGMMFGGAFPLVTKTLGTAGDVLGSIFGPSTPKANPTKLQTAKDAMDAGYVIPPSSLDPSFKNRVLESISGKQATQQIVSTKNNDVTEKLTRQALGIADDVPLTQATLESLRKTAGRTYGEVASISPQAAADLEALKQARNDASAWFKSYNRSASPNDLATAKQYRATADALETTLEQHAQAANRPDLIPSLRDARKQIAKTYTVGRALNDAAGTVDARVLGRMSEKGLPLSDGLEVAGRFASAFPKAAISPQQMGSPAVHNLNAIFAAGGGGTGAALGGIMGGPIGAAAGGALGATYPFVAPPVARSIMFSKGAQRGLLGSGATPAQGLLSRSIDETLPLMYRFNPLLAGRVGQ